ncbi:TlpA family protein disulfide reductase [Ferruginibacter sp. SUN106]|uniref:TlpA family protein disulfide reductase n=1 Tax=Ferruginibacter sp. SUN106 TaxID=2978348 RepID=UPI003D35B732
MKKIIGLNILALLLITQIAVGQDEAAKRSAAIELFKTSIINKPLAGFKFTSLDKQVLDLKKLKGKVVVINFWFTYCGPCIKEMPFLTALVAANKENPVVFIAPAPENETQIRKFLQKNTFTYQIVPSSLDYIKTMHIENFPTHLVIDKDGTIRHVFIGYTDDIKLKLQEAIDKLLQ